jgi:hypothetical protein
MKNTINKIWICFNSSGHPLVESIRYTKKDSIDECVKSHETDWTILKGDHDFKCVKCNLDITHLNQSK